MDVSEYIEKMKHIQNILLEYINNDENDQEKYQKLILLLNTQKIKENKHILTSFIHLFTSIIDYHYRTNNFFEKIFNIILFLKNDFKKYYSDFEIFSFFQNNQRIILFLSEEKIINIEKMISFKMFDPNHEINSLGIFLLPEIKPYIPDVDLNHLDCDLYNDSEDIKEHRKIDYKEEPILQLIQKDLIDEFILQVNTTKFDLEQTIRSYYLETNFLLIDSYLKLIDYSAFFGSIKIFKYLLAQKCHLTPSIWKYAIHGHNPEIIHILEDKNIVPNDVSYYECLKYAIICHENELANYILNNYIEDDNITSYILKQSLKSYNFAFFQPEMFNSNVLFDLCKRDYFIIAKSILHDDKTIDINSPILRKSYSKEKKLIEKEKTYLLCAIEKGNFEIVQLLLECKDIDINKKSKIISHAEYELTPLYAASKNGNKKIVNALLDCNDIDVNAKSILGEKVQTPLSIAIANNNTEIVNILVNRNDIDINLKFIDSELDDDQYTKIYIKEITPLYLSSECGNIEIIQLLLNHKNIDINMKVNIKIKVYNSYGEKCDTTHEEETAIYAAVKSDRTEIAKLLLDNEKIDVNIRSKQSFRNHEYEYTLLYLAISNKCTEIVRMLLENKNIDVNEKVFTLCNLNKGQDIWSEETIKYIKSSSEKSNEHWVSKFDFIENTEYTSLYQAIDIGNVEIVRLLLENENIDVNIKSFHKSYYYTMNKDGTENEVKKLTSMTPLYFAIMKKNIQIVQLLVNHDKIDINMKSSFYTWEYKETYINGKEKEIEQKTVDNNETALHNAVSIGITEIINLILNHKNIDINILDKQGKTPMELSKK